MFASLVQGPLLRLFLGRAGPARPPADAVRRPAPGRRDAAGHAGAGRRRRGRRWPAEGRPRRVRARPDVRPRRRHPARLVVARHGPRRLRRRLRHLDHDRSAVVAGGAVHRARCGRRRGRRADHPDLHRRGPPVRPPHRYRRRRRGGGCHGAEPAAGPRRPLVHAHQASPSGKRRSQNDRPGVRPARAHQPDWTPMAADKRATRLGVLGRRRHPPARRGRRPPLVPADGAGGVAAADRRCPQDQDGAAGARARPHLRRRRPHPRRQRARAHRGRRLGRDPQGHRPRRAVHPPVRLARAARRRHGGPLRRRTPTAGTCRCR